MAERRFNSRCQFSQYLLKQLGSPLVDIVVEYDSTIGAGGYGSDCGTTGTTGTTGTSGTSGLACAIKSQLDYVINDAIDYFREYAADIGNTEGVLFILLEENKNYYDLPEDTDIISVQQPMRSGVMSGLGSGFDTEEAQASVGLFSFSSTFGNRGIYSFLGGGSHDNLLTAEVSFQYMSMVDSRYARKWQTSFDRLQNRLLITPTPEATDHGRIIACSVWQRVPEVLVFDHPWVKRYATALLNMQVGRNTSMFEGVQFPGGGSYNSQFYYNEGKEERDKLEEELGTGRWGNVPSSAIFLQG
jgi:hypothetical protein